MVVVVRYPVLAQRKLITLPAGGSSPFLRATPTTSVALPLSEQTPTVLFTAQ